MFRSHSAAELSAAKARPVSAPERRGVLQWSRFQPRQRSPARTWGLCLILGLVVLSGILGYSLGTKRLAERGRLSLRGQGLTHGGAGAGAGAGSGSASHRSMKAEGEAQAQRHQQLQLQRLQEQQHGGRLELADSEVAVNNLQQLCAARKRAQQGPPSPLEQCLQDSLPAVLPKPSSWGAKVPSPNTKSSQTAGAGAQSREMLSGEAAAAERGEAAPQGDGSCASALGIPKVALLFLTPGPIPQSGMWDSWLRAADGLVRQDCLAQAACRQGRDPSALLQRLEGACGPSNHSANHLFNVYVHPPPAWRGYPEGSPFRGREVANRVKVTWGEWSVVEAMRRLLQAAVADSLNQRFVMVSDSCIPLLPAATVYAQLMTERKSRINACARAGHGRNLERWSPRMERGPLKKQHWRKSESWVMLQRGHAEAVAADTAVAKIFEQECVTSVDKRTGQQSVCIPDEHYLPTLLATQGLDEETDCAGGLTFVHWWGDDRKMQPETFIVEEVCGDLIELMRASEFGCNNQEAIDASPSLYARLGELAQQRCGWEREAYPADALGAECHLFGRKFHPDTAEFTLELFEGEDTLNMVDGRSGACFPAEPRLEALAATASS